MPGKKLVRFLFIGLLLALPPSAFPSSATRQNELLVMGAFKQLYTAEHQYLQTADQPQGVPTLGTLEQLAQAGLIDEALGSGEKFGYRFDIIPVPRSITAPEGLILRAWPKVYRKTGIRSFFMNIDCRIRGGDNSGGFAKRDDPVIDSCSPAIAYEYGERAAADLRTMASAEFTYLATIGNGYYANFDQLVEAGLLDQSMLLHYHRIVITPSKPTLTTPASFQAWSTPAVYRQSGVLSFYIDDTGVLRGSDRGGEPARMDDPPIEFSVASIKNRY